MRTAWIAVALMTISSLGPSQGWMALEGAALVEARNLLDELRPLDAALAGVAARPGDVAAGVALALAAQAAQARQLGLAEGTARIPQHATLSAAVFELVARSGGATSPEQLKQILALDDLREPSRGALLRFVEAFLGLIDATRAAFAGFDPSKAEGLGLALGLPGGLGAGRDMPAGWAPAEAGAMLRHLGIDLAPVLPARAAFLGAVEGLRDVEGAQVTLQLVPALALDLAGEDSTYTEDVALLLDVGGNDLYLNNAGGSGVGLPCAGVRGAAAAVDVAGNDRFVSGRGCGINGGGNAGVGMLVDLAGDDVYLAGGGGTNGGGGIGGAGLLLDVAGNDVYVSSAAGTNGGGVFGAGLLVDAGGDDTYGASVVEGPADGCPPAGCGSAANGGAEGGAGFLLDAGGNDRYTAQTFGTNGGGNFFGRGTLLDAAGDDLYRAGNWGTNGGGWNAGRGVLVDLAGNDRYEAGDEGVNGGQKSVNGRDGHGALLDLGGNDTYIGGRCGANGGAAGACLDGHKGGAGTALLLDAGGHDSYHEALGDCTDCTIAPKGIVGAQVDLAGT